ncbi:hypothetical protein B0H67DRAFT_647182 [Lasiosphaeris hirsuta]|uniref:Uncharacterized protein n=1 Tax=Lasiosphaeris hirsuta TaxID=260670 RepID=A0AA40A9R0_9PEZI|nr:hypothetical protein B0H67DRAFT_647182 [Lasiosphaeris hirsuta]
MKAADRMEHNAISLRALGAHMYRLMVCARSAWTWAEQLLATEDMFPRAPGRRAIAPLISVHGMRYKVQSWENIYIKLREDPRFLAEEGPLWTVFFVMQTEIPCFLAYWDIVKRANNIMCLTAYVSKHSWGDPRTGQPACPECNPPGDKKGKKRWKPCPDFGHDVRETALVSAIVNKGWEWYRVFHMTAEGWEWDGDMSWLATIYDTEENKRPPPDIDLIIQQDVTQPTTLDKDRTLRNIEMASFGLDGMCVSVSLRRLVDVAESPLHRLEDGTAPRIRVILTHIFKGQDKKVDRFFSTLQEQMGSRKVKIMVEYADSPFLTGPMSAKHLKAWKDIPLYSDTPYVPQYVETQPVSTYGPVVENQLLPATWATPVDQLASKGKTLLQKGPALSTGPLGINQASPAIPHVKPEHLFPAGPEPSRVAMPPFPSTAEPAMKSKSIPTITIQPATPTLPSSPERQPTPALAGPTFLAPPSSTRPAKKPPATTPSPERQPYPALAELSFFAPSSPTTTPSPESASGRAPKPAANLPSTHPAPPFTPDPALAAQAGGPAPEKQQLQPFIPDPQPQHHQAPAPRSHPKQNPPNPGTQWHDGGPSGQTPGQMPPAPQ